ncbi:Elongator complex protein [Entomortierella beljakovae]|nr:Elongator complex protein [Entomortierella beljakovae]
MPSLLEKILTGKESSSFILVKDTLEQSGQILGFELLKKTPANNAIILVCSETSPDRLVSLVKGSHQKIIIDCYSDPLGWTETLQSTSSSTSKQPQLPPGVSNVIPLNFKSMRKATGIITDVIKKNPSCTVYFDSLSQFLSASVPDTFNLIRSITGLQSDTSAIIAIYHEDVPDANSFSPDGSKPFASNSLAHIAGTLISIKSSEAIKQDQEDLRRGTVTAKEFSYLTVHGNAWDSAVCEIEHKGKSGKVTRETSAYHLESTTGDLYVVNVWDVVGDMPDVEKLNMEESQTSDPAANLSFNLTLTEEQRRSKNETVLPYLKTSDAADDFDDDDPDDDLTI